MNENFIGECVIPDWVQKMARFIEFLSIPQIPFIFANTILVVFSTLSTDSTGRYEDVHV